MTEEMQPEVYGFILAGGAGTRLWPFSTPQQPKQLLKLFGEHSLLQETALRLKRWEKAEIGLLTGENLQNACMEQLEAIGYPSPTIMVEPVARNTAAAIAMACLSVPEEAILYILPSDHYISDEAAFHAALDAALPLAEAGHIVTFGITPTRPETGYGYIQAQGEQVLAFHEKPDAQTAEQYLSEAGYFWNSGMFAFRADAMLRALQQHQPELLAHCKAGEFARCPSLSIDKAVMEYIPEQIRMVVLDCGWSDIGSWESYISLIAKDEAWIDRPWGRYRLLRELPNQWVKELEMPSGHRLSLQRHAHRSEHWRVLEGVATVLCDDKEHRLSAGESILIPAGALHRLANKEASLLRIIEVQIGEHLSEDDIERFEDDYGRA